MRHYLGRTNWSARYLRTGTWSTQQPKELGSCREEGEWLERAGCTGKLESSMK